MSLLRISHDLTINKNEITSIEKDDYREFACFKKEPSIKIIFKNLERKNLIFEKEEQRDRAYEEILKQL